MKVIIYGADACPNCDKTRMLCQIQSLDFDYHTVGSDISIEELEAQIGTRVRSLPQIFLARDDDTRHVGGYNDLRLALATVA